MKYIDGFRDNPGAAAKLRADILEAAGRLSTKDGPLHIMEVCGTHTMAIARHGIRGILPDTVELISGPGCPVCVTDSGYIDAAIALARKGCRLATFGDMIHVPGSDSTLAEARARGAAVDVCYSPSEAIRMAVAHPDQPVVFLAIGFETTIAPIASALAEAVSRKLDNFSLLTAFKLVPPALKALLADPDIKIDAFLCPAHVSAIIGAQSYRPFAEGPRGVPCVIAGFEPLDILLGIAGILKQRVEGKHLVENQYSRVVKDEGNLRARQLMDTFLRPMDARWRGLGRIPSSGLGIKPQFNTYDAEVRHGIRVGEGKEPAGCLCGDVVKGKSRPPQCKLFGSACTPDHAIGPCMVSSEGTCAAYFKYVGKESGRRVGVLE